MRVLQLGVGSVGEVTARTMATEPEVTKVVLADIDEARLAQVAPKLPAGKVETMQLDVHDKDALVKAEIAIPDDYDVGKGWEHHLAPNWTLKSSFFWKRRPKGGS